MRDDNQMGRGERFARAAIGDVQAKRRGERLAEGYQEAAELCLGLVDDHIDELNKKARSGSLTKQEQPLLAVLGDLKAEMERSLRKNWDYLTR